MAKKYPKIVRIFLGIISIIIGIIGLILPILQGWFFLLLGFTLLGWGGGKKLIKKVKNKLK